MTDPATKFYDAILLDTVMKDTYLRDKACSPDVSKNVNLR
jgi:hypothetical protein